MENIEVINPTGGHVNAIVNGQQFVDMPEALYIPPKALRVILESFEGPLDLLWYLIKKQNIDILDIPVAHVAQQYASYIELMQDLELDAISDYLVMAAMLAQIKSKMLLPRAESEEHEEEDPRAELVRKLQEYEKFKIIAEQLDEMPRQERDIFGASEKVYDIEVKAIESQVSMDELIKAFEKILVRTKAKLSHSIKNEPMSVREKMVYILDNLKNDSFYEFNNLFILQEGRLGVVVTFIAILELIKQNMLQLIQAEPFQPIRVKRA